ncbi:MAG: hypothetical protein ACJ8DZ_10375, partial [Allosphingosinicella sp.]
MRAQGPAMPAYLAAFPHFAANLTPQMPGDVDTTLKSKLEASGDFPLVQREFDLYAWQMFVAVNWPTDAGGRAAPQFSATAFGAPRWNSWPVSSDVFRVDGARPTACGPSRPGAKAMMASPADANLPVSRGLPPFQLTSTNKGASLAAEAPGRPLRRLGVVSAVGELNAANLNEIDQAFSGPLIDRNGEFVFYEIAIDPNEVSYLCQNGLYNINGQVAFTGAGQKVNMPSGTPGAEWSGSWELKFAWRIMGKGDDPSRFYTTPAIVWDQGSDGKPVQRRVTVGLVGLHIGHKSATSPQWIWATFEQTDNLDVDPVAHPKLSASFSNADCPICAVNQLPRKVNGVYARVPTQAWRAIPIPGDKQSLNQQASAAFAKAGSVWQYYQLIDTQWPTNPGAAPSPWNVLPDSITNKSGGHPTPAYLTNITMETYFQDGNQSACGQQEVPSGQVCSRTPAGVAWTSPPPAPPVPVNALVFGTESCTGCHSSAGIWTSYDPARGTGKKAGQLTGDFSWLLTQKANYFKGAPPAAPLAGEPHVKGTR